MIRDRDSNLWVGTTGGLVRVTKDGVPAKGVNAQNQGRITALFEDREGNLWIGTPRGIECLRDSAFVTYTVPGQTSESNNRIFIATRDPLMVPADAEGQLNSMVGEQGRQRSEQYPQPDVACSIAPEARINSRSARPTRIDSRRLHNLRRDDTCQDLRRGR